MVFVTQEVSDDDCAEGQADEDAIQEMIAEISTLEETDDITENDECDVSKDSSGGGLLEVYLTFCMMMICMYCSLFPLTSKHLSKIL